LLLLQVKGGEREREKVDGSSMELSMRGRRVSISLSFSLSFSLSLSSVCGGELEEKPRDRQHATVRKEGRKEGMPLLRCNLCCRACTRLLLCKTILPVERQQLPNLIERAHYLHT
jgi:hypothetical protein